MIVKVGRTGKGDRFSERGIFFGGEDEFALRTSFHQAGDLAMRTSQYFHNSYCFGYVLRY